MRFIHAVWMGILAACTIAPPVQGQFPTAPNFQNPVPTPYGATVTSRPSPQVMLQPAILVNAPPGVQPIDDMPSDSRMSESGSSMVVPAGHFVRGADGESECDGSCDGSCDSCSSCCGGFEHKYYFYGEFLYLRPGDAEVAWATPANSNFPVPPNVPVQIGPLGVAEPDFQPGFRAGFQYNMTECAGISAQYTMYEATTNDFVAIGGANVINSLVSHPAIDTTAQNFRQGTASYNINYDLIDIDYHKLLWYDSNYQFGFLAGLGLVQMEQQFTATFAGTGTETVRTDIDFYGAGSRFGLQGEVGEGQYRFYGKGLGSLISGVFRADYDLGHSYDAVVVDTAWRGNRIVGIWDLETGFKWISCCRNYSANIGYVFSAWNNVVQTDQWIRSVQTSSFIGMDDTMTFDGLVARFEARF